MKPPALKSVMPIVVMTAASIVAALAFIGVSDLRGGLEDATARNTSLEADLNEQEAASAALAEQVKRLGGKPVVDPPVSTPSEGQRDPGPTDAQVEAAVADYCAGNRCKPTVSRSQVAAAVADYCAGGACRARTGARTDGADGTDGTDGQDGTDGKDGAPGPGPTAEQIASAVADYCADGRCSEPGKDGKDGADGKDATITPSGMDCPEGERVNGVHLLADGSLTVSCAPLIGGEE